MAFFSSSAMSFWAFCLLWQATSCAAMPLVLLRSPQYWHFCFSGPLTPKALYYMEPHPIATEKNQPEWFTEMKEDKPTFPKGNVTSLDSAPLSRMFRKGREMKVTLRARTLCKLWASRRSYSSIGKKRRYGRQKAGPSSAQTASLRKVDSKCATRRTVPWNGASVAQTLQKCVIRQKLSLQSSIFKR